MEAFLDGDTKAFDELFRRLSPRVVGFLRGMSGDARLAEDLAQTTFLKVHRARATYQRGAPIEPWIFAIARNLTLSHRRREGLSAGLFAEADTGMLDGHDLESPFDRVAASELEHSLEAAMASLAPSYREVLLLVAVEGMTPLEASSALGLKPDAVRQRLARARAMVEDYLATLAPRTSAVMTRKVR